MRNIDEELKEIIVTCIDGIDKKDITEETDLIKDLGYDSVNIIQLIVKLEEYFEIEIDDEYLDEENLTEYKMFPVGKKITGIEIVSEYNRRVENGFENLFDYGVIIRMGEESLMLATGCWFDESIDIYEHDDYERVRPLQAQKVCLCQGDEGAVEVKRFQRKL